MSAVVCQECGTRLNWVERAGKRQFCREHDPEAIKTGHLPYDVFCMHPARCDGLSSCPRDYSCVE